MSKTVEIKDELHVAVSQNLNSVAERVLYTCEAKDDIEIEQFNCDSRRVHPMQFLSRVREFNRFNSSSWEIKSVSYTHLDVYKRQ